jgi:hypothetical protein
MRSVGEHGRVVMHTLETVERSASS